MADMWLSPSRSLVLGVSIGGGTDRVVRPLAAYRKVGRYMVHTGSLRLAFAPIVIMQQRGVG